MAENISYLSRLVLCTLGDVLIDTRGGNNVIAVMGTAGMRSVSVFGQRHINIKTPTLQIRQ